MCIIPEPSHEQDPDGLVKAMGMTGISKSQASRLCTEIDDRVDAFLERPIDGAWPYLWLDATYVRVRRAGRIVSAAVIVAVGANTAGRRGVLGLSVGPSDGAVLDRLPARSRQPRPARREAGDLRGAKPTVPCATARWTPPWRAHEAFPPAQAKALWDRFEFLFTPKHGSWLNVAEVELNVMIRQCLNRRIDSIDILRNQVAAWQAARDRLRATVNWQFTTTDARVKLKRLYPTFDA